VHGVGERRDGRRMATVDFCLLLPLLVRLLVLNKTSVWSACMSKILTDILFYVGFLRVCESGELDLSSSECY